MDSKYASVEDESSDLHYTMEEGRTWYTFLYLKFLTDGIVWKKCHYVELRRYAILYKTMFLICVVHFEFNLVRRVTQ